MTSSREELERNIEKLVLNSSQMGIWEQVINALGSKNTRNEINGANFLALNQVVPLAAKENQYNLVFILVTQYSCNVEQPDNEGATALFYAMINCKVDEMKKLRTLGAKLLGVHSADIKQSSVKQSMNEAKSNNTGKTERSISLSLFLDGNDKLTNPSTATVGAPVSLTKTRSQS